LSEHLVDVQKHVEPPKYLLEKPHTDLTSLVAINDSDSFRHVNILKQWPDSQSHGLDKSQSQALHRILTNRLAIVQGPPGTGKTYVSVVALKILLANMKQGDPPIIVTCQTNHALDQLLRHAAEFETDFIRLGGRSKDRGKIKERTLYEVRMQTNQKNAVSKSRAMAAIRNLTKKMQMLLAPLEAKDSLLDHKVLQDLGLLTEKQADSIYMDALCTMGISADTAGVQMEQWIGKNLMPCSHPKQPDEIGDGAYEEEDFEVEQLQELEAEAVAQDDDDIEALPGPRTLLNDNVTGITTMPDDDIRQLLETDDLYTIPAKLRGAVYNYFLRQAKRIICAKFRQAARDYYRVVHERKIGQWEQDLTILSGQRLIGMTTTGLSKYRGLIAALQPKIVVVEEAAETLEAPVTAACLPSLEHLILVGDHQQLRPHCQVREFEDEPIHFNLSLFERMVANSLDMDCLTRQRRMIPEIRRLLEPIYGTTLKDHPSVTDASNRPPVEGMGGCNSFFFTHEWLESCDANKSAINDREASMVAGFFDYLVLNGVSPSKITVLTFYNGQRKMLSKKLALHPNLRAAPLKVVTVDSYQGEENDIVLLSLVRSNNKHKIGFLNVDNRVCVALSRARRGFYIFGNGEMLACESATWGDVVEIMYGKKSSANNPNKRRNVGYHLPLQCSNHGRKVWIEDPDDWDLINGGCDQKCGCALPCGHKCTLRCHP
jgi:helicase required for RNAi-mediated heterochromatin assembly 1